MEEITTQIPEYEYQRDKSVVVCIVCGETFKYKNNLDNDFRTGNMIREFSNLKHSLKAHLSTARHMKKVKDDTVAQRIWEKEEGRNKAVGMRIGKLVYYLVSHRGI